MFLLFSPFSLPLARTRGIGSLCVYRNEFITKRKKNRDKFYICLCLYRVRTDLQFSIHHVKKRETAKRNPTQELCFLLIGFLNIDNVFLLFCIVRSYYS